MSGMRSFIVSVAAVAAILWVAPAPAAEAGDWYAGARIGLSLANRSGLAGPGLDAAADWKAGAVTGVFVGREIGGLRGDLEFVSRRNGASVITDRAGGATALADGAVRSQGLFVNLYRDLVPAARLSPYVGFGLGVARVDVSRLRAGGAAIADGSDVRFAYRLAGGLRVKSGGPGVFSLDYRYTRLTDPTIAGAGGSRIRTDHGAHGIFVGYTYRFGRPRSRPVTRAAFQPPPAPPEQPAPPPPPSPAEPTPEPASPPPPAVDTGPFLVFFDWDKADIRADAVPIIDRAAAAARAVDAVVVRTTGHADRSGPEWYNLKLSLRRARAVRAELVRRGIDPAIIVVRGLGESAPLVPTPDGVREPRNRRVEILLETADQGS